MFSYVNMGGKTSKMGKYTKESMLVKEIEYIAANYIITQNFDDMKNLTKPEYCDNLIIMTADIIANKLNKMDISYLSKRLNSEDEPKDLSTGKVLFLRKADIKTLDNDKVSTKKHMCIGIARFYIKVAHLFGAILSTINPIYVYKDMYGVSNEKSLKEKDSIPNDAIPTIIKRNVCNIRQDALINNQKFDVGENAPVNIEPYLCDVNYDKTNRRIKTLKEEVGFAELEKLYYDVYDYENGGFTKMSDKMKDIYQADVATLNKVFGEDQEYDKNKFSEIHLKDYRSGIGCKTSNNGIVKSYKNKLFVEYATHIHDMTKTTAAKQDELYSILKQLFSHVQTSGSKKKGIIINPKLTNNVLQQLIDKTRETIVGLYVKCETDFNKGLEIYKAVVEQQKTKLTQKQIVDLEAAINESAAPAPDAPAPDVYESAAPVPDVYESAAPVPDVYESAAPVPDVYESAAYAPAAYAPAAYAPAAYAPAAHAPAAHAPAAHAPAAHAPAAHAPAAHAPAAHETRQQVEDIREFIKHSNDVKTSRNENGLNGGPQGINLGEPL